MKTPKWKPINSSVFEDIRSTGRLQSLTTEHWPDWTRIVNGILNIDFTILNLAKKTDTGLLSTIDPNAKMIMERFDQEKYKYYSYYLVSMDDGRIFQSGPYKDNIPGGHHQINPMSASIL